MIKLNFEANTKQELKIEKQKSKESLVSKQAVYFNYNNNLTLAPQIKLPWIS